MLHFRFEGFILTINLSYTNQIECFCLYYVKVSKKIMGADNTFKVFYQTVIQKYNDHK